MLLCKNVRLRIARCLIQEFRACFKMVMFAHLQDHVMDFTRLRALSSLFSMISQGVRNVHQYNQTHPDFPMKVRMCLTSCGRWLCLIAPSVLPCYLPSYLQRESYVVVNDNCSTASENDFVICDSD